MTVMTSHKIMRSKLGDGLPSNEKGDRGAERTKMVKQLGANVPPPDLTVVMTARNREEKMARAN